MSTLIPLCHPVLSNSLSESYKCSLSCAHQLMKLHGAAALYVGQSGQPPKCGVLQRQPWSWSKRSLKDEEEGTGGVKRPRPREGRCSGNIELCAAARVLERWPSCRERGALWGSLRTFISPSSPYCPDCPDFDTFTRPLSKQRLHRVLRLCILPERTNGADSANEQV